MKWLVMQVFPVTCIPFYLDWDNKFLTRRFRKPKSFAEANKLAKLWNLYFRDWCSVKLVRSKSWKGT